MRARVRDDVRRLLAGYVRARAVCDAIDTYIVAPHLGERAGVLGALALGHALISVRLARRSGEGFARG